MATYRIREINPAREGALEQAQRTEEALQRKTNISRLFFRAAGWDLEEDSFIVKFIASSSCLEHVELIFHEFGSGVDFELARACLEACGSNANITGVKMAANLDDLLEAPRVLAALKAIGQKMKEISLAKMENTSAGPINLESLENVEKVSLGDLSGSSCASLLRGLSENKSPRLKELDLRFSDDDESELQGIDTFLASSGAKNLEILRLSAQDIASTGMVRLVGGLSRATIKELDLSARVSLEASQNFAAYLCKPPVFLGTLKLQVGANNWSEIQDIIMPSLWDSTIEELWIIGLIANSTQGEETLKNLLIKNQQLKTLVCTAVNVTNAWIQSTSDGLRQNTTLRSLQLDIGHHEVLDICPIFDALRAPMGLRELTLTGCKDPLTDQRALSIAAALQQSSLEVLDLKLDMEGAALLSLLSAVPRAQCLKKLRLVDVGYQSNETWKAIGPILPHMKLVDLLVMEFTRDTDLSRAEEIQKELLRGMELNETLEVAKFKYCHDTVTEPCREAIKQICTRNKVRKMVSEAANKLKSGGLPIGVVPRLIKPLSTQSTTEEERLMLSGTVLFSVLQSGRLSDKAWMSIRSHVSGSEGLSKAKRLGNLKDDEPEAVKKQKVDD